MNIESCRYCGTVYKLDHNVDWGFLDPDACPLCQLATKMGYEVDTQDTQMGRRRKSWTKIIGDR